MEIDEFLKHFISSDGMRPNLAAPWIAKNKNTDKDFVCATNGHIAVIMTTKLCEEQGLDLSTITGDDDRPDIFELIESEFDSEKLEPIDFNIVSGTLEDIKTPPNKHIEPEFMYCDGCFGDGKFETNESCSTCGATNDPHMVVCHGCKGAKYTSVKNPRAGVEYYEAKTIPTRMKADGQSIFASYGYIKTVEKTFEIVGKDGWRFYCSSVLKPLKFYHEESKILLLLMPCKGPE